jgi:hypothetical protein
MTLAARSVRRVLGDDARLRLHNWLCSRGPTLGAYALLQPKIRPARVTGDTDLVIEGFPRSANTYALAAFRCANGEGPVVADHLHAAASVRDAVERRIPAIVVLRDPVDSCVSLIQRQAVRPGTALEAYVRFHTGIRPVLGDIVVSDFTTTTTAFGSAIAAANSRFGTSFVPYDHTEANEAWCRTFVVEADRVDQGEVRESTVALPQAARHRDRQPIVDAVLRERELVTEARRLYAEIRTSAVTT